MNTYQSESNDESYAASISSESESLNVFQNFFLFLEEDPSAPQLKTITLEEYGKLMQLIPEVEKLKNVIRRMENVIKSKDQKMNHLQKTHQSEQKMNLNLSSLSNVINCGYAFISNVCQDFSLTL